eukprot:TRINITY_DN59493_c0_g1_i1.p1 TRINITY_DN59493_c0_g1~~TRINITY_DN59493_c0_g1_i1.p1  ORF type:complete len:192 (-),score=18.56 TRINITY_DN59493_c0_g1_i1:188-763(-)
MTVDKIHGGYLTGQLLIAMPTMMDPRFERTVIYMCLHNAEGAMGLVVNKLAGSLTLAELMEQLDLEEPMEIPGPPVHFGGPVETSRGFVLHSDDYMDDGSMQVSEGIALTATIDILKRIATGDGPDHAILCLGYAGWGPGQLDNEIQANGWLQVQADSAIVFDRELETKWQRAVEKLGIDPSLLSVEAGHA